MDNYVWTVHTCPICNLHTVCMYEKQNIRDHFCVGASRGGVKYWIEASYPVGRGLRKHDITKMKLSLVENYNCPDCEKEFGYEDIINGLVYKKTKLYYHVGCG